MDYVTHGTCPSTTPVDMRDQARPVRSARTEFQCKPGNQAGSPLFGVEIQDFQDLKPNPEISSRDLSFGRGQVWDEAQI